MSNNISEEIFYEKYKPIKNHYNTDAAFDGHMFETYGEEIAFVVEQSRTSKKVWTIIESDEKMYIVAGFHYINRVGYMITEEAWSSGDEEVELDSDELTLVEAIDTVETALRAYVEDCLDEEVDSLPELQDAWDFIKIVLRQ